MTISYSDVGNDTLMLVFSPTCPHCRRNWPVWSTLANSAEGKRIVYVNIGGRLSPTFTEQYGFGKGALVVSRTDPESILQYSLLESPTTLYISSKGRVEHVWSGEMGSLGLAEAMKAIRGR